MLTYADACYQDDKHIEFALPCDGTLVDVSAAARGWRGLGVKAVLSRTVHANTASFTHHMYPEAGPLMFCGGGGGGEYADVTVYEGSIKAPLRTCC